MIIIKHISIVNNNIIIVNRVKKLKIFLLITKEKISSFLKKNKE